MYFQIPYRCSQILDSFNDVGIRAVRLLIEAEKPADIDIVEESIIIVRSE